MFNQLSLTFEPIVLKLSVLTQAASKTITVGKITTCAHLDINTDYSCYQNTQQGKLFLSNQE